MVIGDLEMFAREGVEQKGLQQVQNETYIICVKPVMTPNVCTQTCYEKTWVNNRSNF